MHRVVIIGGGFGGLSAARALKRVDVHVTLIDRRNFHLFQPLLYQVATGGLSAANIAEPLRSILRRCKNVAVMLDEATDIDVSVRRVVLRDRSIAYDTLLVATGARHHYFGHPEWEALAPSLKTIEDATEIRRRVLLAFEKAESEADPAKRRALITFVIVGGGPTGVELAGALGELAQHTLRREFSHIDTREARIVLLEGSDRLLLTFPPKLSAKSKQGLEELGVTVRTGALVTDIQADRVVFKTGEQSETLEAHTALWAAGVSASPLGAVVARATGATLDRAGRVTVGPDLTVPGHPEIFVVGDLANFSGQDGKPLPGVAPVAMQQGRYVARLIRARLKGRTLPPFRYFDKGNMATIGRAKAVADLGWLRLSGYPAWLAWLFIHLFYIITLENRLLVLIQWAWNYFTRNRSARLITGTERD